MQIKLISLVLITVSILRLRDKMRGRGMLILVGLFVLFGAFLGTISLARSGCPVRRNLYCNISWCEGGRCVYTVYVNVSDGYLLPCHNDPTCLLDLEGSIGSSEILCSQVNGTQCSAEKYLDSGCAIDCFNRTAVCFSVILGAIFVLCITYIIMWACSQYDASETY